MIEFCTKIWFHLREISGDDAYERYLIHWHEHHACQDEKPMTRKEFYQSEIERKWSGVKRCC